MYNSIDITWYYYLFLLNYIEFAMKTAIDAGMQINHRWSRSTKKSILLLCYISRPLNPYCSFV